LSPRIEFSFEVVSIEGKNVVVLEIDRAYRHPVRFKQNAWIRVGSYKKKLKDFPNKEGKLWRIFDETPFEDRLACENLSAQAALDLLDYPAYFQLTGQHLPASLDLIVDRLVRDRMLVKSESGNWNITNLGAILFAKALADYPHLARKAVRVVEYEGDSRTRAVREQVGTQGYASGFEGLIRYITGLVPSNEVIETALRKVVPMYPPLAIRELVANAIIHQDFHVGGSSPMIELFASRIEITNPGRPLIEPNRFLDSPPRSRNDALASFMRRIGVCEERGSGIDKVVFQTELFQLPAPLFEIAGDNLRCVLFAHRELKGMGSDDRIRACYLHACLKYVNNDFLTNTSVRERFGIEKKNAAKATALIKEAIHAGAIEIYDAAEGKRARKYVPAWAKHVEVL
jgi:predicted HTH transcriptional regulator